MDLSLDVRVSHRLMDGLDALVVAKIGRGGVGSVDSEELALDVGLKVIDPVNAFDLWMTALETCGLDAPFVEGLDPDVEAAICWLGGHDAIDSTIAELGLGVEGLEGLRVHVAGVDDEFLELVGGIDHVLAGDDGQRLLHGACLDGIGDRFTNEFEDIGADGASDNVCFRDSLDSLLHLIFGVDGSVVIDRLGLLALSTNLCHRVGGGAGDLIDQGVDDIEEDDAVASLVEQLSDEAATNVTTAEVDCNANHGCGCGRGLGDLTK